MLLIKQKYRLNIKKPLVIDASSDVQAIVKAHQILNPGKAKKYYDLIDEKKWMSMDKQNSSKLIKAGYDALIYRMNGRVREIQIPKSQIGRLKKVKQYKYDNHFYSYDEEDIEK